MCFLRVPRPADERAFTSVTKEKRIKKKKKKKNTKKKKTGEKRRRVDVLSRTKLIGNGTANAVYVLRKEGNKKKQKKKKKKEGANEDSQSQEKLEIKRKKGILKDIVTYVHI